LINFDFGSQAGYHVSTLDFNFLKLESEAESKQSDLKSAQVMVIILSPLKKLHYLFFPPHPQS
jgi:hypothetical protein